MSSIQNGQAWRDMGKSSQYKNVSSHYEKACPGQLPVALKKAAQRLQQTKRSTFRRRRWACLL